MRFEIPECSRCCFCVPLRYGLLIWSYLILAPLGLLLALLIAMLIHDVNHGWTEILKDTSLILLNVANLVFTILLIIAAHKKSVNLLKIYNKCGLSAVIANFVALIADFICDLAMYGALVLWFWTSFLMFLLIGLIFIGMQMYIIALVRSEIIKLESNVGFEFQNIGAEAEKQYYEPNVVIIDNQKEYDPQAVQNSENNLYSQVKVGSIA
ncbi:hypothetical protein NE865_04716 [Phthorimaea operculella]|nr:hypothetical protein NE865_04716 [Phthorimaea operculella]